jgi:predicted methyltransferase
MRKGNLTMMALAARLPTMILMLAASTATMTPLAAGEAPPETRPATTAQQQFDAPEPKPYEVPSRGIRDYIKKAVELPSRPPHHRVHDAYRKPAELLQFSNVRPGQRVVELSAYGNYWSTLLSEVIGPKGELHMYDPPFALPLAKAAEAFVEAHPNARFQNVDFNDIEFPRGVDLVWCYACFHEVLGTNTHMDPFLAKLYKAMKPGARILIVFYTARDGMENRDVALHRIDKATVLGTLQAAGFRLEEENRLLQNPNDDRKTQVLTEADGDLADRMIYRFIKP